MALTTVTVHGEILAPVTNVPAVGTVTFDTLQDLRDVVDNIVYTRKVFTATLDVNGEFTIVLPATDNPDLSPTNWVYQVYVNTDQLKEVIYVQIPFAPGVTEFADLVPLDFDPCAGTSPAAVPIPPSDSDLFVRKSGDTMTGNLIINANLQVNGDAGVSDDLAVGDQLGVGGLSAFGGDAAFNSQISVAGNATFSLDVTVGDDLTVNDDLSVLGDVGVTGLLTANSASIGTLSGLTANFTTGTFGDLNVTDDLTVTDDAQITGDLNVDGTLTAEYQGVNGDVMRLLSSVLSTNVTSGGELIPNVDLTKIDISATTGWIIDYNSTNAAIGPTNPKITYVTYPGTTGLVPTFAPITFYLIDSTGTLIQQATVATPAQRRQNLLLGFTVTEAGNIIVDQTIPVIPSQLNNQLVDLMNNLRPFSTSGNLLSPNGATLTISKASGQLFARAFSQVPTYLNPHEAVLPAQAPMTFRRLTGQPGFASGVTTIFDVANYDPNGAGVITPVGGGANTSTNFRVWAVANNTVNEQILVQYGQRTYASLTAARDGIGSGTYIPNPLTVGMALLGWVSVTRTATNLSDPTQAIFVQAGKFATP